MKTMTQSLTTMALVALLAAPAAAQVQAPTSEQIADDMEAAASTLQGATDRWDDAATLYVAAAKLRAGGDGQAQTDLFAAANLYVQTGNVGGAIDALETAGSRALASGDTELAQQRFGDAALVAQHAGLSREHQRLSYRTAEVAMTAARDARVGELVGAAPFPR